MYGVIGAWHVDYNLIFSPLVFWLQLLELSQEELALISAALEPSKKRRRKVAESSGRASGNRRRGVVGVRDGEEDSGISILVKRCVRCSRCGFAILELPF